MITPNDIQQIEIDKVDFDKLEKEIDRSILTLHGFYKWEEAVLTKEYPECVRNTIAKRYRDAGWRFVYHITSSENGERPGLTRFKFSQSEIKSINVDRYHCVY